MRKMKFYHVRVKTGLYYKYIHARGWKDALRIKAIFGGKIL